MRALMIFLFSVGLSLACSGDCKACHPSLDLDNDIRHTQMKECKTCHTDESLAKINMGDTCGKDCFACHDINSVLKNQLAHGMIKGCISCHNSLNESMLDIGENIFQKSIRNFTDGLDSLDAPSIFNP